MSESPRALLELAVRVARDAGDLAQRSAAEGRHVKTDEGRDVKIEADNLLDRFIIERLVAEAPLPIVSEESGGEPRDEKAFWIVDPLDGTFNFLRGLPFACISIAVWRAGKPVLGVVHDFARDECFSGVVGGGAWLNGDTIRPSSVANRAQAVLCTGIPLRNTFGSEAAREFIARLRTFKKTRLLGSAALMLSYVACGRADAYGENAIALWDVAAGLAIVQAAGGYVTWRAHEDPKVLDVEASNGLLAIGQNKMVTQ